MDLNKTIDRLVSSLVFSLIMAFFSFSFFTGKFPPSKDDMSKAYHLIKGMMSGSRELHATAQGFQDNPPSIAQIADFQRQQLKLTESSIALQAIFEKLPQGPPNAAIAEKLLGINNSLAKAEKELGEVTLEIKKAMEPPAVSVDQ